MWACFINHLIISLVENHTSWPLLFNNLVRILLLYQFLCFFNRPVVFGLILPTDSSISISTMVGLRRVNALFILDFSLFLLLLNHRTKQVNLVTLVQVIFAEKHTLLWIEPLLQTDLFTDSIRLALHCQAIVVHVELLVLIAATAH